VLLIQIRQQFFHRLPQIRIVPSAVDKKPSVGLGEEFHE
jgi:hypothetical protein